MLNVAICGASGYAGAELLRILVSHSEVRVTVVTSEKSVGKRVTDLFPHLHHYKHLTYDRMDKEAILSKADFFFMALPHSASQEAVDFLIKKRKRVIDLSADYRLRDSKVYEEWYKVPHRFSASLKKAVYGLPELYRKKIRKAGLIANPGCYPTGAILGLYPALKNKFILTDSIVIDSKSGVTGAGRQSDVAFSFCEVNDGVKAYGIASHRHTPEIEQELSLVAGKTIKINFTPHLIPIDRGILSTIYARIGKDLNIKKVHAAYRKLYAAEPFVRILDEGRLPNAKHVRGSNLCEIGLAINKRTDTLVIITALDNIVKGAAGQAVQNMNIMLGFNEKTALDTVALFP